jgi:thiol:disulfide interchange protein DsbD
MSSITVGVLLGFVNGVFPVTSPPGGAQKVSLALVPEVRAIAPGKAFWVAVRFEIEPGWHIYWQNPGSSGLPTFLDWQLPRGLRVAQVEWPAPKRFTADGATSYGYSGTPVVLAKIEQSHGAGPVGSKLRIGVQAEWLVCKTECLAGSGHASTRIIVAARTALEPAASRLLERARAGLPKDGSPLRPRAVFHDSTLTLQFAGTQREAPIDAYFFAAKGNLVDPDQPQMFRPGASPAGPHRLEIPTIGAPHKIPEYLEGILCVSFPKGQVQTFRIEARCSGSRNH